MKFCKDCGNGLFRKDYVPDCHAPKADEHRDPVTGEWPKCEDMRKFLMKAAVEGIPYSKMTAEDAEGILCGSGGKWFKGKDRGE